MFTLVNFHGILAIFIFSHGSCTWYDFNAVVNCVLKAPHLTLLDHLMILRFPNPPICLLITVHLKNSDGFHERFMGALLQNPLRVMI